jgi:hypothetical protein
MLQQEIAEIKIEIEIKTETKIKVKVRGKHHALLRPLLRRQNPLG